MSCAYKLCTLCTCPVPGEFYQVNSIEIWQFRRQARVNKIIPNKCYYTCLEQV